MAYPGEALLKARQRQLEQKEKQPDFFKEAGQSIASGMARGYTSSLESIAQTKKDIQGYMEKLLTSDYMPVRLVNPQGKTPEEKYQPIPASQYGALAREIVTQRQVPNDIQFVNKKALFPEMTTTTVISPTGAKVSQETTAGKAKTVLLKSPEKTAAEKAKTAGMVETAKVTARQTAMGGGQPEIYKNINLQLNIQKTKLSKLDNDIKTLQGQYKNNLIDDNEYGMQLPKLQTQRNQVDIQIRNLEKQLKQPQTLIADEFVVVQDSKGNQYKLPKTQKDEAIKQGYQYIRDFK